MTEEEIFQAAAEIPAMERATYLLTVCQGQPAMRARVERLLASHDDDEFMHRPADRADSAELGAALARLKPEEGEDRIGHYKLLEPLGEGGFGTVWMAEQLEPVRRRLALKIVKLGMDTEEVLARFEQERQALALMDHPSIAKVLDAGVTPLGRPFFVMELVQGIRITDFCDQNNLPTRERLELFIAVCNAIQHAHQKGIIHRDIKPSNILVTLHDGVPVPKVIDFGVAKAIESQRLTDLTFLTRFEQMIGTPLYMSPEQAEMSGLDIDTRSDIYSLGVLLYELLTGKTPFDAKKLMALGIDAIRKTIRETEPVRPSARVTQELAFGVPPSGGGVSAPAAVRDVAASRPPEGGTPSVGRRSPPAIKELILRLKGDLDWIVMKCLEKDRARRYDTANGLAADLKRHLNNEPVVARPPSTAYRLRKAWRRNKLVYTAGVSVFLALAAGLAVAALGWIQTMAQRDAAQASEERAIQEGQRAELAREETRRNAYAAEINVAFQALAENNLGRAIDLLNRQRPKPGEVDLRGFEWRHLWQLCQSDVKVTFRDAGAHHSAFSLDGRWLAYGGDLIVIRELPSQAVVKTILTDDSLHLAFSPDGKLLASGHKAQVRLWSTESWEEEQSLPEARYPAVFSPDGQWLVTGAVGGYRVWSTTTWQPAGFCPGEPKDFWQSIYGVAFSPDGRLLVTAGHPDGFEVAQFQVWDFPALTVRTNLSPVAFELGCAVFTPDSMHLLIGDEVGRLMVWDVAEGRVVETLNEHTSGVATITYTRDGRTMATFGRDRTLVVWDWETRKALVRLRGHLGEVWSGAMSPDGRMLASGSSEGTISLWDASTRRERRMLPECGAITGFSADSRLLVVQGLKDFRLWRLADGAVTTIPLVNYVNRGPDSWADVHGLEPYAVFGMTNGVLEHWNLETMSRVASWRVSETGVSTATVSRDGRFIAISDVNGVLKLWDARTHREVRQFTTLGGRLEYTAFSPDDRLLAGMINNDKPRVCIWDVNEGSLLLDLNGYSGLKRSLAFSPDGKLLATAHQDHTARLWEIPSGNLKATLKGHVYSVMGVTFSPDGKTLATGGYDRKVKVWNIATEQELTTLDLLPGSCISLRFSPDGRTLAAGSWLSPELYMSLWEVPSFEEIAAAEAKQKSESKQP